MVREPAGFQILSADTQSCLESFQLRTLILNENVSSLILHHVHSVRTFACQKNLYLQSVKSNLANDSGRFFVEVFAFSKQLQELWKKNTILQKTHQLKLALEALQ